MKAASLVSRLALLQLVAAGTLLVAFALSTVILTHKTLETEEGSALQHTASDLAAALKREWNEDHDLGRAARATLLEDAPSGVTVEILDGAGRLVVRTPANVPLPPAEELRTARQRVAGGAWVVVSVSTRQRHAAVRTLAFTLFLVGLPLFALTAVLSRTAASRLLSPLRRMASQARNSFEDGVISPLGGPGDPLELQHLANAFNLLLQRLDRMLESERRFTQDAAHELRTPLTVISGEIEYAIKRVARSDPSRSGLDHAAQQAHAMSDLIDALLFLRRAEADSLAGEERDTPINLSDVVRERIGELVDRAPERRADVTLDAEDEVLVAGNGVLVTAAIRNLISNALKFTSTGTPVRLSSREQGNLGLVVVEDGGKGIRPEDRERIFDPYFRDAEARASHEGFGIGLSLVRRIIRAHRGDVVVSSSGLGGARFELSLPKWEVRQ